MSGTVSARAALAVLGFLLLAAKLGFDLLGAQTDPVAELLSHDAINYAGPLLEHVHASLWRGDLPLWNPYLAFGSPVAGELGLALFFPVHWLVFFFQVPLALLLIQFVTVAVAAAGMYRYGRFLDMAYPAALLTAGLFAYIVYTESYHHSLGSTICLLPWVLMAAHRFTEAPGLRRAVVLALCIGLCFLAGFPNYFVYTLLVTALSCLLISFSARGTRPVNYYLALLSLAAVAGVLFVGLIAAQLLPTLELTSASVRGLAEGRVYNPDSAFEVFSLTTAWRDMFSTSGAHLYANSLLKLDMGIYYLGAAVALVPFAFFGRTRRRHALVLLACLVLLLLLVLSYRVPALWLLQEIPMVNSLRMNGRVVAYVHALLVVIAGLGLTGIGHYLSRLDGDNGVKAWVWLPLAALLPVAGYGLAVDHRGSALLALLAAGALLSYLFTPLRRHGGAIVIWVIALAVMLDVSAQRSYRVLVPALMDRSQEAIVAPVNAIRESGSDARVLLAVGAANYAQTYRLQNRGSSLQIRNIGAYTNFTLARWRNLARELAGPEAFDALLARSVQPRFYGEMTPGMQRILLANATGMDILSLRHVIADDGTVTERDGAMPRAYAVSDYSMAASEKEALDQIGAKLPDLRHSVVLEGAVPDFPPATDPRPAVPADVDYLGTNRVAVTVDLDQPSVLVLTDAFMPGWRATVDGEPADMLRANSLFRAVAVDAGRHRVDFVYRPRSLYLGLGLTVASLAVVVLLLVRLPRR